MLSPLLGQLTPVHEDYRSIKIGLELNERATAVTRGDCRPATFTFCNLSPDVRSILVESIDKNNHLAGQPWKSTAIRARCGLVVTSTATLRFLLRAQSVKPSPEDSDGLPGAFATSRLV